MLTGDKYKSIEEYKEVYDSIGPGLLKDLSEVAKDVTESFLLTVGDVKGYATTRELVNAAASSVLLYLVTEGKVTLNDDQLATAEEQAERALQQAEADVKREQLQKRLGDLLGGSPDAPGYL